MIIALAFVAGLVAFPCVITAAVWIEDWLLFRRKPTCKACERGDSLPHFTERDEPPYHPPDDIA
jgi:hypothetical protein